ncbi:MAG: hypothetical protein HYT66_00455 [Candidatus Yanofskybacteria bacterium]|nr:hypothetical protein [Candidatus Yanofskybacteria bacterium]
MFFENLEFEKMFDPDIFREKVCNSKVLSPGEKSLMIYFSNRSHSVEGAHLLWVLTTGSYPDFPSSTEVYEAFKLLIKRDLLKIKTPELVMGQRGYVIKIYMAVVDDWADKI